MDAANRFARQAFLIPLIINTVMLALIYVLGGDAIVGAIGGILGVGIAGTLLLGFVLQQLGRRAIEQAAGQTALPPSEPAPAPAPKQVEPAPKPEPKPLPKPDHPYEASAVQVLALLQRKGRLIDFLQEDLQLYADDQIGAAVRPVHEGCKSALQELADLVPVYDQNEGQTVTVEPGFDAHAVRLTGNVAGDPPFTGTLQHRGWKITRIDLPEKLTADQAKIVAPAEVEV